MNNVTVVYRKLSEIKPYEKNPRKNDEAVVFVANSISMFGFKVPIVIDKDGVIVAGHTRYKAAKKLNLKEVPCIVADDLTEEQVKAFRLADNKVAEKAEWDFDLLADELDDLFDFDMTVFGFEEETEEEPTEVVEDDFETEIPEEPKAKLGDIYQLGRHRLMCGDSTDKATIEKLMDGNKADMVFTDPPYNIGYQGVSDKRTIQNDKMSDDSFVEFLENSLMPCETMYVCCSWQYSHLFRQALENIGQKIKAMIVWDKINPAQHLDKYFKQHEIIWYCGEFGGEKTLRGDVWQCKRQRNTVHPTMKPIELIAMAIQDQPKKRVIYDGFGGSGSTLIACEQLGRTCYMMELDPKYIDVIIERWEQFTGEKAVLLNG
jgi:site-specific DNA-methyltransferase (adenine-specific)